MDDDVERIGDVRLNCSVRELDAKNDKAARAAKAMASAGLLKPATAPGNPFSFPNRPTGPSKPAGFA